MARSVQMTVYVSPGNLDDIEDNAAAEGVSVSEYVRNRLPECSGDE